MINTEIYKINMPVVGQKGPLATAKQCCHQVRGSQRPGPSLVQALLLLQYCGCQVSLTASLAGDDGTFTNNILSCSGKMLPNFVKYFWYKANMIVRVNCLDEGLHLVPMILW